VNLSFLSRTGGSPEVVEKFALGLEVLDISAIVENLLIPLESLVVGSVERGETPLPGNNDLLPAGEFVPSTSESLDDDSFVLVTASDGHDDLTNVDTGHGAIGLAPSTTHTLLQPIRTSARQHLVDSDDVERVDPYAEVERLLASRLHNVLVGADTGGLESLRGELLILVRNEMAAEGEVVDRSLLASKIKDTDFGVGNTTVVPRFGEGLVLAVAVAASGTTTHFERLGRSAQTKRDREREQRRLGKQ